MTDTIDCADSPCIHGTCIYGTFSYHCDCNVFFGGINCDEGNTFMANECKMYIKQHLNVCTAIIDNVSHNNILKEQS